MQPPGRCTWKSFPAFPGEKLGLLLVTGQDVLCMFECSTRAVYQHQRSERP